MWWESRPRRWTGRMKEAPSEIGWRRTLKEGTMAFRTSTRSEELTLSHLLPIEDVYRDRRVGDSARLDPAYRR